MSLKSDNISKLIDHTLLKANASRQDIQELCSQAIKQGFFSVCINPYWVKPAVDMLKGEKVRVCSVIGFPLGAYASRVKAFQSGIALEQGAHELDMVVNIGAVKDKDYSVVEAEIKEVKRVAGDNIVKVIIETCFLTQEEKVHLCKLVKECGADFVKTSTGFGTAGATVEDVRLLRETVGSHIGVKASGGIRNLETLMGMVEAGANRIGTSSGIIIMEECKQHNMRRN